LAELKPWTPPAKPETASTEQPAAAAAGQPGPEPVLVSSTPKCGETEVDPALPAIEVMFDQEMAGGFSWIGGGDVYPKTTDKPYWKEDKRTCVLPVQLDAGKFYRVGINSKSHKNFKSTAGTPVAPTAIAFTTKGADATVVASLQPPKVIRTDPPNGSTNVSPSVTQIVVTFDKPMSGGFSWTGGGDNYPETSGPPQWNDDKTVCTLPVKLKPKWTYRLGLNSKHAINFQSPFGIPLEPVAYTITTGE
jgi:hypothetical protein